MLNFGSEFIDKFYFCFYTSSIIIKFLQLFLFSRFISFDIKYFFQKMVHQGVEPWTLALLAPRSNQLS